ncbi:MAG: phosphodiester glycosidase family protein, partial [Bacteroidales bacterium]|nr:phosphodiester glycosidase family protein [Bacteroidales bacterium]
MCRWEPFNFASPYALAIDFDGDGHTISNFSCSNCTYAGFFGVLNGACKNVSFTNAEIAQNLNSACGILAGYAG